MFSNIPLLAAFSAVAAVLPLLLVRRFVAAGVMTVISFFVLWAVYYIAMPTTIWPLFGFPGLCVAVFWVVAAMLAAMHDGPKWGFLMPVGYVVALIVTGIYGWSLFNASTYATLIGEVEERVWTDDVQPKDPRHMRMVSDGTALYIAQKAVANAGAIGSQFQLDSTHMTLQRVKERLVYVIPFDFSGFSKWTDSDGVPAFIIVDAEDPERQPRLVKLEGEELLNFTPNAYFGYKLKRYLRQRGFVNDGLSIYRFELDEDEKPHWVIPTYKPTVSWWGKKVTDVATVDPSTGDIARYALDEVPGWIDRVYPYEFVNNYANWWGTYSGGWLNSWWGQQGLTQTEVGTLIYGEGDKSEWVIGITSTGAADDSLIGLLYVDSRTGKPIYYRTNGGATDEAILESVNNNQYVKIKTLHGTTPQIYNVYGRITAVVPLVNSANGYQGVAMVPLDNVQNVAVGPTQSEALRGYQSLIYRSGQQVALNAATDLKELTGIIDRIRQDVGATGSVYLFHIEGAPRIFTASSGEYVKLGVTQPGDTVAVSYVNSGEDVVPVQSFDNLSLPLDKSKQQEEVGRAAEAKRIDEKTRATAGDLVEKIKSLSPDELVRVEEFLKQ
ncbi:hypothetical protein A3F55_03160 [Candidatus Adlerbacteria bacterium RIFCSPHIGHO2_12_FULL_53_18]|uniref:Uncharacterized protein n=1 Tax=Candidatus Adlerbacteria bacterium RIFCSPHIGHO2_12_FULL_53_18 TaxID=1797242 RepID=A0A1F4XSC4_9BACT|nr:MAG: hypothetical protein A3F55_03160 [Candidatus Adlerbacteria bacterium RIFCSPHIGHO2_12_FULL_53_18]